MFVHIFSLFIYALSLIENIEKEKELDRQDAIFYIEIQGKGLMYDEVSFMIKYQHRILQITQRKLYHQGKIIKEQTNLLTPEVAQTILLQLSQSDLIKQKLLDQKQISLLENHNRSGTHRSYTQYELFLNLPLLKKAQTDLQIFETELAFRQLLSMFNHQVQNQSRDGQSEQMQVLFWYFENLEMMKSQIYIDQIWALIDLLSIDTFSENPGYSYFIDERFSAQMPKNKVDLKIDRPAILIIDHVPYGEIHDQLRFELGEGAHVFKLCPKDQKECLDYAVDMTAKHQLKLDLTLK
jgi:hypothetical protein